MLLREFTPEQIGFFLNERNVFTYKTLKRNKEFVSIILKKYKNAFLEFNKESKKWTLVFSNGSNIENIQLLTFKRLLMEISSIPSTEIIL